MTTQELCNAYMLQSRIGQFYVTNMQIRSKLPNEIVSDGIVRNEKGLIVGRASGDGKIVMIFKLQKVMEVEW
jgi:hypothetical protein